jgi:hypothetical protein
MHFKRDIQRHILLYRTSDTGRQKTPKQTTNEICFFDHKNMLCSGATPSFCGRTHRYNRLVLSNGGSVRSSINGGRRRARAAPQRAAPQQQQRGGDTVSKAEEKDIVFRPACPGDMPAVWQLVLSERCGVPAFGTVDATFFQKTVALPASIRAATPINAVCTPRPNTPTHAPPPKKTSMNPLGLDPQRLTVVSSSSGELLGIGQLVPLGGGGSSGGGGGGSSGRGSGSSPALLEIRSLVVRPEHR